jgi:hypothetical protein
MRRRRAKPTSVGIAAQGGTVELSDSTLVNLGTYAASIGVGAHLTITRSLLLGPQKDTATLSSVLVAATDGGVLDVVESALVTTQALASVTRATLDRVLVRGAAGPAVAFAGGRAIIKSSRLTDSRVGLLATELSSVVEVKDEPTDFLDDSVLMYESVTEGNEEAVRQADGTL